MIAEMVFLSVFWLNAFPNKLGVSQTLSPKTIVTGLVIDYDKHCRIEYGQYVQTHEKHDNTMATRTIGALALRPTGNLQGGHYFFSLMTGKRLHRTHWTELPMPAEVKDRVHALARRANAYRGLAFTDSDDNDLDALFPDDDDDSDYDPDDDDDLSYASSEDSDFDPADPDDSSSRSSDSADAPNNPDLPAAPPLELAGVNNLDPADNAGVTNVPIELPGVHEHPANTTGVEGNPSEIAGADEAHTDLEQFVNELESELDNELDDLDSIYRPDGTATDAIESDVELDDTFEPITEVEADAIRADATREQSAADSQLPDNDESDDDSEDSDDTEDGIKPLPRLRRNRTANYSHLKGRDGDGSLPTVARPEEFRGGRHHAYVILQSIIMTQYNLKQGIKKFGDKGKEAVLAELQQLYDRAVMEPVHKYDLTPTE